MSLVLRLLSVALLLFIVLFSIIAPLMSFHTYTLADDLEIYTAKYTISSRDKAVFDGKGYFPLLAHYHIYVQFAGEMLRSLQDILQVTGTNLEKSLFHY